MENKTDDIFRDKLKNWEQTPNAKAWEKISAHLSDKPKRKAIPVGWMVSSMAASVALVAWISLSQEKNDIFIPKNNENLVKSNMKSLPEVQKNDFLNNTEKAQFSENVATDNQKSGSTFIASEQNLLKQVVKVQQKSVIEIQNDKQITENEYIREIKSVDMITISSVALSKPVEKHELPEIVFVVEDEPEQDFSNYENTKKKSKISRVFAEIKKLKKGEKVNYKELSLDKKVILASVKEKFQ
ncbi:MAG: hypothetical protein H7Y04_03190 [Verrucomicrobia bacterium]|nr:hypothetical protein [Cytophagales bacterium]